MSPHSAFPNGFTDLIAHALTASTIRLPEDDLSNIRHPQSALRNVFGITTKADGSVDLQYTAKAGKEVTDRAYTHMEDAKNDGETLSAADILSKVLRDSLTQFWMLSGIQLDLSPTQTSGAFSCSSPEEWAEEAMKSGDAKSRAGRVWIERMMVMVREADEFLD